MAIKQRNRRKVDFSAVSMSDLVFLLLIFFMLTSTMVAPNAIKLLLPSSNNRTIETPPKYIVSIDKELSFFLQGIQISESELPAKMNELLKNENAASIRLEAEKTTPVQNVVGVLDIVNDINKEKNTRHKVILATSPKK